MGISRIVNDLLKSPARRKVDAEKRRIRAMRKAENAIYDAESRVEKLEGDNAKSWSKARELMKSGRKSAARIELCKYRAVQRLVELINKKVWLVKFYLTRLESAGADANLVAAIGEMSSLINIDPNKTLDAIDDVQDKLVEATEIDRVWENVFASETRRDSHRESELLPDVDELMSELEKEAAREVGGKLYSDSLAEEDEISRGIAEGRDRLKDIIDAEDKKRS